MGNELLDEFIFDARDHLSTAGVQLLELERDPDSLESLNGLLGTLHTIKGNSGFVNLKNLYGVLHAAENLLQTVREAPGHRAPPVVINQLFQVLDTVEAILTRLETDKSDDLEWLPTLNQAIAEAQTALEYPESAYDREMASTSDLDPAGWPGLELGGPGGLGSPGLELGGSGGLGSPGLELGGPGGLGSPGLELGGSGGLGSPGLDLGGTGGLGSPGLELGGSGGGAPRVAGPASKPPPSASPALESQAFESPPREGPPKPPAAVASRDGAGPAVLVLGDGRLSEPEPLAPDGVPLVLDLGGLTTITAGELRTLAALGRSAGGRLALVADPAARPDLARVLRLWGLDRTLKVFGAVAEAETALADA
jgi:HPt (histidine-containing phosphotransfer) domain-containing protein